jgi:hypothetical protein
MGAKALTRPLREARTRGSEGGYREDVVAFVVRREATYYQLDFKESGYDIAAILTRTRIIQVSSSVNVEGMYAMSQLFVESQNWSNVAA